MYLVESAAPFSRSGADITAHVGYAGGFAEGPGGLVRHQPAALSAVIISLSQGKKVCLWSKWNFDHKYAFFT